MIIDSSAILAVIGKESGYERIVHQLAASPATRIGAPTRLETAIVLTARFGPRGKTALARFLQENSIETVAFGEEHASVALDASAPAPHATGARARPGKRSGSPAAAPRRAPAEAQIVDEPRY